MLQTKPSERLEKAVFFLLQETTNGSLNYGWLILLKSIKLSKKRFHTDKDGFNARLKRFGTATVFCETIYYGYCEKNFFCQQIENNFKATVKDDFYISQAKLYIIMNFHSYVPVLSLAIKRFKR